MRFLSLAVLLTSIPCIAAHAEDASPEARMRVAEQRILGMLGIQEEAAAPSKDVAPAKPSTKESADSGDPSLDEAEEFIAGIQEASANILGAGLGALGAVAAQQNGAAINQDSTSAQLLAGKAYAFGASGDRRQAIEHYEQAVRLDPSFHKAIYNLACEYAKDQQQEKALLNLQKAVAISAVYKIYSQQDPDFASLHGDERFKKLVQ